MGLSSTISSVNCCSSCANKLFYVILSIDCFLSEIKLDCNVYIDFSEHSAVCCQHLLSLETELLVILFFCGRFYADI